MPNQNWNIYRRFGFILYFVVADFERVCGSGNRRNEDRNVHTEAIAAMATTGYQFASEFGLEMNAPVRANGQRWPKIYCILLLLLLCTHSTRRALERESFSEKKKRKKKSKKKKQNCASNNNHNRMISFKNYNNNDRNEQTRYKSTEIQ